MNNNSQLCSVSELRTLLKQADVHVLDCSWYLPSQQKDGKSEFNEEHIPGAHFFDIDSVCDSSCDLPHMLPSDQAFAEAVGSMGIENDSNVVVYDSAGLFSAARVWWMFKVFGHDKVQVLDGGLPAWKNAGGALSKAHTQNENTHFKATLNRDAVAHKAEMIANRSNEAFTVLDARSAERFNGTAPEPRKGLPAGHMPQSVSLPFNLLVENGRLKPANELVEIFNNAGVNDQSAITTSCGSGVTAAIITLALYECGYGLQKLYDGAWAEWGSADDTIILDKRVFD